MRLGDLFRRQAVVDASYDGLEASLSDMILLDAAPPLEPGDIDLAVAEDLHPIVDLQPVVDLQPIEDVSSDPDSGQIMHMTTYSQARLAELSAFDDLNVQAMRDLEAVSTAMAHLKASQHQAREFLTGLHGSIHRANELEVANARLTSENRVLYRQAEQVRRLKDQHESLIAAFRQREGRMTETNEELRQQLSSAKLELTAAEARIRSLETERKDALKGLASASSQNDLMTRELEVQRERQIHLVADLDAANRKRTEAERRVDELGALHGRDASDLAELRSKFSALDAERQRLQRQCDAANAQVGELTDSLRNTERDADDRENRHEVALTGLNTERDTLLARLDVLARGEAELSERVGALQIKLSEALADKAVLHEKLTAVEAA